MAGTITLQTIVDGDRVTVIKAVIGGDAELTKAVLFDASAYTSPTTNNSLKKIQFGMVGLSAQLFWDATADVGLLSLPDLNFQDADYDCFGIRGLPNNAGAGKTGDILISTSGLAAGDHGHIILWIEKKPV